MSDEALSTGTVAYYQSLLAQPHFARDNPSQAAVVKNALDRAIISTGWQPPPPDPRTPAQILHDDRHGVVARSPTDYAPGGPETAREALAGISVEPLLGNAILRELAAGPAKPAEVK